MDIPGPAVLLGELLRPHIGRGEAAVEPDRHQLARGPLGGHHGLALLGGVGQGLLHIDRLAGLQRLQRQRDVLRIRRGDDDGLDLAIGQQLLHAVTPHGIP